MITKIDCGEQSAANFHLNLSYQPLVASKASAMLPWPCSWACLPDKLSV